MPKQNFKVCLCWRRIFKTRVVEPPRDVETAFYRYSPSGKMTVDELLKFLIEHQGEKNATKDDAQAIFDSLMHLSIFHRRGLHLEAFFRYLLGDLNFVHPLASTVLEYDTTGRPDFGGQACFPVPELRSGIRAVPLFDKKGIKYMHVRLLLRINFERPYDL